MFCSDLQKDSIIRAVNVTNSNSALYSNKVAVSHQIAVRLDVGGPDHRELWNRRNPTRPAAFIIESLRAFQRPCFQEETEQALCNSRLGAEVTGPCPTGDPDCHGEHGLSHLNLPAS